MSGYTSNRAEGTGYRWVEGPDGKEICSFSMRIQDTPEGGRRFIDLDNAEENARFIAEALNNRASAPELKEALEALMDIVEESRGITGYHLNGDVAEWGEFDDYLQFARAALAKARGES